MAAVVVAVIIFAMFGGTALQIADLLRLGISAAG
jgi:hypothetical protein